MSLKCYLSDPQERSTAISSGQKLNPLSLSVLMSTHHHAKLFDGKAQYSGIISLKVIILNGE